MRSPRIIAGLCAGTALLFSLVVEHELLTIHPDPETLIPGLLDLRYTWNYGVSFSLFRQDSAMGNLVLSGVLVAMIGFFAFLAWQARDRLSAGGFGLIVGGALANLIDRQIHGAVFDFLALHLGAIPLFICNAPDITISVGVMLLLWDEMFRQLWSSNPSRR